VFIFKSTVFMGCGEFWRFTKMSPLRGFSVSWFDCYKDFAPTELKIAWFVGTALNTWLMIAFVVAAALPQRRRRGIFVETYS